MFVFRRSVAPCATPLRGSGGGAPSARTRTAREFFRLTRRAVRFVSGATTRQLLRLGRTGREVPTAREIMHSRTCPQLPTLARLRWLWISLALLAWLALLLPLVWRWWLLALVWLPSRIASREVRRSCRCGL